MSLIRDISDAMKPMFATFLPPGLPPYARIAVSLPALSEEDENGSIPSEETEEQATEESGSPAPVAPIRAVPYQIQNDTRASLSTWHFSSAQKKSSPWLRALTLFMDYSYGNKAVAPRAER